VPQLITILPVSGGVGETINITGTGFSSVAANNVVKFNNVTATVNSVSFSLGLMMLSTTVPAGATTGQLTIQVNGGTVINSGDFQVLSGTWTSKAIFPGSTRMGAVGFSIGNKGYIGTGRDASNVPVKEFWEFDPATNTWSQKANFAGTARWNAVGFGIGSKGYIGTGDDGTATGSNIRNDFWEYDPATNVWTERANFGGSARMNATGFAIGTKGYIGTGITSLTLFTRVNDFWEYDPGANAWTQRANVGPTGRGSAKGFAIGTKGYIVGGEQSLERQDTWEYNPTNNTWTQRASHPTTVGNSSIRSSSAVGFAIGAKGYICTGDTGRTCIEYDPSTNQWKQVASLVGDGRNSAVGFSIGSKGYLGLGGFTSVRFNSFHEFTP
jgi:N-acetylneuraminic acid mutarotase